MTVHALKVTIKLSFMTTVRALLKIPKVGNMFRHLSSPDDNGQSMVTTPPDMKQALPILVIPKVRNILSELSSPYDNGQSMIKPVRFETCSVSCHHLMATVRACWYHLNMEHAPSVSSSRDIGQSMLIPLRYETCFISCHHLMTMVKAWWYPSGMKNAPSVVVISWQRSEHGYTLPGMKHAPSDAIVTWQRSKHGDTPSGMKHALLLATFP